MRIFLLLAAALGSGTLHATECYRAYDYSSEGKVLSGKLANSGKNILEGVLHARSRVVDGQLLDMMYFFDSTNVQLSISMLTEEQELHLGYPVKVVYHKEGVPEKALAYDGAVNAILKGITRDFIYPQMSGSYHYDFDEMKTAYEVKLSDDTSTLIPLSTESKVDKETVIRGEYSVSLAKDHCVYFDEATSFKEMVRESDILSAPLTVYSEFTAKINEQRVLTGDHWFMQLSFDDNLWLSPDVSIETEMSKEDAQQKISDLINLFSNNLDNEDMLLSAIGSEDSWLIYLADYLAINDIDKASSMKLFMILGRLNTSLTVDTLNRVAQRLDVHEDHRFRSVTALLTTDAPLSNYVMSRVDQVITDAQFIDADISSRAYVMSLGAIAAERSETAPGQTTAIRDNLVTQLNSSEDPLVPLINAVGNLKGSYDSAAINALENIATHSAGEHQKVSSLTSLARLGTSHLNVNDIQNQYDVENAVDVKKGWIAVAAHSDSIHPADATNMLFSVAEKNETDNSIRDYAVTQIATQFSDNISSQETQRLRGLIPRLSDKSSKKSIYKLLVKSQ